MSFDGFDSARVARFQRKVTLLSAGGTFLDGFDLTIVAVALPLIKQQWNVQAGAQSLLVSSAIIGSFVGAILLGRLTDRFGRKAMYVVDLLAFVIFAALTALSQDIWQLIAFRFLLGVGIGADYPISATLVTEFSSRHKRGQHGTFLAAMWFVGAVAAYLVGLACLPAGPAAWRYMFMVGAVFALVIFFFRITLPESPRWLQSRGRIEEAQAIMLKVTGEPVVLAPDTGRKVGLAQLFSPALARRTLFVFGFWFCYATAYYGIAMYTPTLISPFAQGSHAATLVGSGIVAVLGMIGAFIGMKLVDSWGRRPLLITSFAGLTAALVALAMNSNPSFGFLVVLFSCAVLFANSGGGILNFVYPTELFPTDIRAGASGMATGVSRIGSILGVLVFPNFVAWWGNSAALWFFSAIGAMGLIISVALAPETKGTSLEELNQARA
ncbi:MFS transporter [Bordetella genomosp. 9]|uniref:MFS transporter n=1 Tax=Bordetella genomosp. 9 TaxID=1416803 RepID=A0A261RMP7_9BORD|nr:MFS transporter [Bordetella genomosp. 9]OZI26328.1 MFS transporter [Bordetella genomosp. 9]